MAFDITQETFSASREIDLKPNIVLKIEGISTCFGGVSIVEILRYGQNDAEYGDQGIVYGGTVDIDDQKSYISFEGGTSSEIRQTIQADKGVGESTSNLTIAMVDKNNEISDLISPGNQITDILGQRCKVYFGFQQVAFPESYITIFRGIVQSVDAGAGLIKINLSHPDQKKLQTIFVPSSTQLDGSIGSGDTTITVDDTTDFLTTVVGPDGSTTDPDFKTYIRVDDEIISYTGKTSTTFTGCVRGELGTSAVGHSDDEQTDSFYRVGSSSANVMELALKLMLSGSNDFAFDGIDITNFVRINAGTTVANSIFFDGVNIVDEYNVQVGDYIETTGSANPGSNDVSPSTTIEIDGVVVTDEGSYVTVAGVSFVEENDSGALAKFRSQYDVWPEGAGLQMKPDEVDVAEHLNVKNTFLPSFVMDFYLTEEIEGKDFLAEQIYNPTSSFSLPRKSQASVGTHSPPLPNQGIRQLNIENTINPSKIQIKRSISKNLTNTVVYKFDERVLEDGKFDTNTLSINATAIDQVGVGRKSQVIESKGIREVNSGTILASAAASRRLKKYAFGAEFISGVQIHVRDTFQVEVGDKVLVDFSSLKITDIQTGTRAGESRIMEVQNKRFDMRKGKVTLDLVDTNFDKDSRFALTAPSSVIRNGLSATSWIIEESFGSRFGINEFQKWENFLNAQVRVVSPDYTTRDGNAKLTGISGNTMTVETTLGFTPVAGDYMLYSRYDDQILEDVKLLYVHLSDDINDFADGGVFYGLF